MEREQAIEKLNDMRCHVKETSAEEQALVMAIDALKQPVATDINVGDTISRQQAAGIVEQISDINRGLAIGKTLYYASCDEDEIPGFRWAVSAMTIADISYCGRFLDQDSKTWLDMAELDADLIFWHHDVCDGYCHMRNSLELAKEAQT